MSLADAPAGAWINQLVAGTIAATYVYLYMPQVGGDLWPYIYALSIVLAFTVGGAVLGLIGGVMIWIGWRVFLYVPYLLFIPIMFLYYTARRHLVGPPEDEQEQDVNEV